jgi:hypothetical protein
MTTKSSISVKPRGAPPDRSVVNPSTIPPD